MKNKIYRFVPVFEDTHKRLKLLTVEEEKTFDEMIKTLISLYKAK